MKYSGTPLAAIVFLHVTFLLSVPVTADLIDDACDHTTHEDVCSKTLRSHPQSSSADLRGLAIIMANATIAIGDETLSLIESLIQDPTVDLTTRRVLESCKKTYILTVSSTLPRARAEIKYGAYELANEDIEYARDTPNACEYGFGHETVESPLKENDRLMSDLTNLCFEFVDLLIKSQSK